MKIAIIGYSGSGKSTLAHFLAKENQLPILHMDTVHWLPGWNERERAEELQIVQAFMDGHDAWVIDGNYSKTLHERRMEEADWIIFMKFGRISCFFRALKRYSAYRGKTRESMTKGCPEKFDFEFMCWILWKGRSKAQRRLYGRVLCDYADKVIIITNQRELTKFMDSIQKEKLAIKQGK